MGSRFGRRKKKALELKIAQLEKDYEISRLAAKNEQRSIQSALDESHKTLRKVAHILGNNFVGLPVETEEVKEIQARYRKFIERDLGFFSFASHGMANSFVDSSLIWLETYRSSAYLDEARRMIHMRFQSESDGVGYGLSDHAWINMSEKQLTDTLVEQIAPDMAKHLINIRRKALKPYTDSSKNFY